jgi:nitrous oxidase accessory protein
MRWRIAVVLLLLVYSLIPKASVAKGVDGGIIHVPGDYSRIGWAVGNATDGDTIFVASGIYQENVIVNKSVRIIGENRNATIVDGGGFSWDNITTGFSVVSENVSIENFTFRNAFHGIRVENARSVTIQNNILKLNGYGIRTNKTDHLTIQNNFVLNNTYGISVEISSDCIVRNNTVMNNYGGVPDLMYGAGLVLGGSNFTYVLGNYFTNNLFDMMIGGGQNNTINRNLLEKGGGLHVDGGLYVDSSDQNVVANNTLKQSVIIVDGSSYNLVKGNFLLNGSIGVGGGVGNMFCQNIIANGRFGFTMELAQDFFVGNFIINCTYGINIHYSNGSTFYHNNLINNTIHVTKDVYTNINTWDNGKEGNYWSNYTGQDNNIDAIGDQPHILDTFNIDRYPLMAPINIFDAGTWNDTEQQIHVISSSTVTAFQLNKALIKVSFNVTGTSPTLGFCRITIPNIIVQNMWNNSYMVLVDDQEPLYIKNWTDATNTYLYITYQHSQQQITIVPEFPTNMLIATLTLTTVLYLFLKKKMKN